MTAEVTEATPKTTSPDDHLWEGEDKSSFKADIKSPNLVGHSVLSQKINGMKIETT